MFSRIPPVTQALLIANVVVYLLQQMLGQLAMAQFMLWPLDSGEYRPGASTFSFMPWQLLTYGFMHGSLAHLLFNMLALFMFGTALEHTWGNRRFLTYFLVCVAGAGVLQLMVGWWTMANGGAAYPTLGASGGVFGVLLGYGLLFPNQRVMLMFPPIPMKARTLVIVYGAISLLLGFTGMQPGIAHFAHLGGMLFGWLMIRYWRGQPPFGGPKPPNLRSVK